ncbi:hypothetical protein FIBSPDRAFT_836236, partial [Athelia psychrophila]
MSEKSTSCSNPECKKPTSFVATKQCAACHKTRYCSVPCSKADWPKHKKVCFSEKRINAMLDQINAAEAAKPKPRPSKKSCTGCGVKFTEHDSDNEDEDEESEDALADACGECGYMCCESCISDTSNGSCHCHNSNFGSPYCSFPPRWYHGGRGKSYVGDRHPEGEREDKPEGFEASPRACGNCGEVDYCMKKQYLK